MTDQTTLSASNVPTPMFKDVMIGFIGSGVMGEAMIAGLLKQQTVTPHQIIAADPLAERGQELQKQYGVLTTTSNLEVAHTANIMILSVKPQVLDKVMHEVRGQTDTVRLVLSIIAGEIGRASCRERV